MRELSSPSLGLSPADVKALPPEALPGLLAALAALQGAVAARLAETPAPAAQVANECGLVDVGQAARIVGLTHEQFLRRSAFRPAIVKQGHRTLRVNAKRLERILAQMQS